MPKNRKFRSYGLDTNIEIIPSGTQPSADNMRDMNLLLEEGQQIFIKKADGTVVTLREFVQGGKANGLEQIKEKIKKLSSNSAVSEQLISFLYAYVTDEGSEFDEFIESYGQLKSVYPLIFTQFLIEQGKNGEIILTRTVSRLLDGANPPSTILDKATDFYSKTTRLYISPLNVPKGTPPQAVVKRETVETVNMENLDNQKTEFIRNLGGPAQSARQAAALRSKLETVSLTRYDEAPEKIKKTLYINACNAVESYANKNMFPLSKYLQDIKQLFNLFGFDKNKFITAISVLGDRDQKEITRLFENFNNTQLIEIHRAIERWGDMNNSQHRNLAENICSLIPDYDPVASEILLTAKNIKRYLFPDYQIVKNLFFKSKTPNLSDKWVIAINSLGQRLADIAKEEKLKFEKIQENKFYLKLKSAFSTTFTNYQLTKIYEKISEILSTVAQSDQGKLDMVSKLINCILVERGIRKDTSAYDSVGSCIGIPVATEGNSETDNTDNLDEEGKFYRDNQAVY